MIEIPKKTQLILELINNEIFRIQGEKDKFSTIKPKTTEISIKQLCLCSEIIALQRFKVLVIELS